MRKSLLRAFALGTLILSSICFAQTVKPGDPFNDPIPPASAVTCQVKQISQAYLFRDNAKAGSNFKLAAQIDWAGSGFGSVTIPDGTTPPPVDGATYLVLLSEWKADGSTITLTSSNWYVYKMHHSTLIQEHVEGSASKPLLPYGARSVTILGIQIIHQPTAANSAAELSRLIDTTPFVSMVFAPSVVKGDAENRANLGALLGAVAGVAKGPGVTAASVASLPGIPACMEKVPVDRIKDLPVDLTVSFSMTPGQSPEAPTPPKSSSSPDICFQSKKSCTISRTFGDEGKYWWDVNLGITLPGIREAKFSFDSKANNVAKSVTRHTDIYAFASLYPLAYWWRRGSYAPHFDVGIPLTGQPLHRPFFGAAERIPGSKKLLKTPGFFYAGVVRLIEGTPNTLHPGQATDAKTFAADFNPGHVVWKMMYGVEFSVGSLISKVGKK